MDSRMNKPSASMGGRIGKIKRLRGVRFDSGKSGCTPMKDDHV
jgi:hypothetical protein